jgi:DNA polymerase III subunit epsilon
MESFWDYNFVVVDVETTGADAVKNRITDIACVTVSGGQIVSEFSSLINPHQFIPEFISKMTGITNEMVYLAPEPEDILPEIKKIFNNPTTVFVAHNLSFDWGFIKETFNRVGDEIPEIPRLCSLKLARRLLAGNIKKGVSNLSKYFKIPVQNRHRALGDAMATAKILIELLERAEKEHDIKTIDQLLRMQNRRIKNFRSPTSVSKRLDPILNELPDEPGVYYFYDNQDKLLYVGKAKCLSDRVRSYFSDHSQPSRKISEMTKQVHRIEWECTDTELSALILESRQIKRHVPYYNSVDLRYRKYPFIVIHEDEEFPRIEVAFDVDNGTGVYYGPFRSMFLVDELLKIIDKQFKIRKCQGAISPNESINPCFFYQIQRCLAPCANLTDRHDYREELERVKSFLSGFTNGVIEQLENKMSELSDSFSFEEAASVRNQLFEYKRILNRKEDVPTSINSNNLIVIVPASSRSKTVEVFFIKTGRLISQFTIGRKASLKKVFTKLHANYYNGQADPLFFTVQDIDELRIITSWINKHSSGIHLYLNGKNELHIRKELEFAIRNIKFEEITQET